MTLQLRLATIDDAEQILAIYAPIVRETTISFEHDVPTLDEMQTRIQKYLQHYPYLVCEDTQNGQIAGYAYASLHRGRWAYQWSVECSAYVHTDYRKQGIGRTLYRTLFNILREQGFYNVYAGVTQPNPTSVAFHEAIGFEMLGMYKNIGYKLGEWHDVIWYALALQDTYPDNPTPPIKILDLPTETLTRLLSEDIEFN